MKLAKNQIQENEIILTRNSDHFKDTCLL